MFHIYFLRSSEGLIFDVANANFDVALWNPLQDYLEIKDVRFHTGVTVTAVHAGERLSVRGPDGLVHRRRRCAGHRCVGPAAHRRRLGGTG